MPAQAGERDKPENTVNECLEANANQQNILGSHAIPINSGTHYQNAKYDKFANMQNMIINLKHTLEHINISTGSGDHLG